MSLIFLWFFLLFPYRADPGSLGLHGFPGLGSVPGPRHVGLPSSSFFLMLIVRCPPYNWKCRGGDTAFYTSAGWVSAWDSAETLCWDSRQIKAKSSAWCNTKKEGKRRRQQQRGEGRKKGTTARQDRRKKRARGRGERRKARGRQDNLRAKTEESPCTPVEWLRGEKEKRVAA